MCVFNFKCLVLFCFLVGPIASSYSQAVVATDRFNSLPIKINGKLTEWERTRFVYKINSKIYYLVSNDNQNLYLIVKSKNQTNNFKINGGGISFTINVTNKKSSKSAYTVTFPIVNKLQLRDQMVRQKKLDTKSGKETAIVNPLEVASLRKQAVASMKEIKVSGFKNVEDTLISIYNEIGIRTGIDYDTDGSLNYELAIPLSLCGLNSIDQKVIAFNIRINPVQTGLFAGSEGFTSGPLAGTPGFSGTGFGDGNSGGRSVRDLMFMRSSTDFWGSYVLKSK